MRILFFILIFAGVTSAVTAQPSTRTYFVAADELVWDYTPSGRDMITGALFDTTTGRVSPQLEMYANVRRDSNQVGHAYKKALYREYTDATFSTLKPPAPEWEHLGFMGPLLRAEVGDTIVVVFRNNASRPYTMHPHGVFYEKDSEGTPYRDGTSGADKLDDGVLPGHTHTYTWIVSERAGPGPHDPSSIMWMYHSHVDEGKDINAGLMGPIIVSARGMTRPDGTPKDVDREFVVMFSDGEEASSWYIDDNIRRFIPGANVDTVKSTPRFNLRHLAPSMNGWMYGNMPLLTMEEGERIRWYIMAGTNGFDFHTPHWHGHTVLLHGHRMDIISVEPMMMAHVDMVADNPGIWFFHCHVTPHMNLGMNARYVVYPKDETARTALAATIAQERDLLSGPSRFGDREVGVATHVPGWLARLDDPTVDASQMAFRTMGDGFHATTGRPAAVIYNPGIRAGGPFRAQATFTQTAATAHPEAYGLVFGGKNLDRSDQEYLYFLIRQDGKFLVKRRSGDVTHTIVEWSSSEAIQSAFGEAGMRNTLAVEVVDNAMSFYCNDREIVRLPRDGSVASDGIIGFRINHMLDVHVDDFEVAAIASTTSR